MYYVTLHPCPHPAPPPHSCTDALKRHAPHVADNTVPTHSLDVVQSGLTAGLMGEAAALSGPTLPLPALQQQEQPADALPDAANPRTPSRGGSPARPQSRSRTPSPARATFSLLPDQLPDGSTAEAKEGKPEVATAAAADPAAAAAATAAASVRDRIREDAVLLRRVGEVVVSMHAQAQELYRQLGLLDTSAGLPLSKVGGRVNTSKRK